MDKFTSAFSLEGKIALVTGAMLTTAPISLENNVEAATYSSEISYFTENLNYTVERFLDKELNGANLQKLLESYDTLYDFIYNNKKVNGTYYRNLQTYEQNDLVYLLESWEDRIYYTYKSESYFKTKCKNELGFYLNANSSNYEEEHDEIMEYFTETLSDKLDRLFDLKYSQGNLQDILAIYEKLMDFIKNEHRISGYIFDEMNSYEQQELVMLAENWTYDIMNGYEGYNYYTTTCIREIGWTVNISNLHNEINYNGVNNNINSNNGNMYPINTYPQNSTNYPQNNVTYPTAQTYPQTNVTYPTQNNNTQQTPIKNSNGETINNTVGKNWQSAYQDPTVNTSRGISDYVPEDLDEQYNYYNNSYNNYNYYNQYNGYNQYNPYDMNNGYNNYNQGYVEDYVPTYIP